MSKEHEFSPRTIVPLFLASKEVVVMQYDRKEECLLGEEHVNADVVSKYKRGMYLR